MCTVTYIPLKDRVYITSNRDEKISRQAAIPPKKYSINNHTLIFPKDAQAGGTWIAINENGHAGVLLNGAFVKHTRGPYYKKSRGLIFLDLIATDSPVYTFRNTDFSDIEPYTIVITENEGLFECRWDGHRKYCRELNRLIPYIWSSATLYDDAIIKKREIWFARWISQKKNPRQQDIFSFHQFTGEGDTANDLVINRDGLMLTVSITSIGLQAQKASIKYLDLPDYKQHREELPLILPELIY